MRSVSMVTLPSYSKIRVGDGRPVDLGQEHLLSHRYFSSPWRPIVDGYTGSLCTWI